MDTVGTAERLADDLLFPAALATDAAQAVPVEHFDALARAGLYGISGPAGAGGLDADFDTVCAVVEALSSGCLTTTFVWAQHVGAVNAAASSDNPAISEWVAPLCRGEVRAGLALGGAVRGPPILGATESTDGWTFTGSSPFVSGWRRIDVLHAAARTGDGRVVWALVDAAEGRTITATRLDLSALNATDTVRVDLRDHPVPTDRVTSIVPFREGPAPPHLLRFHASFALGVAARCIRLMGPTPLEDELAGVRQALDRLDPATIEADRGSAGVLALRASAALLVATGSRSLLVTDHAQRLAREALFALVYALRPGSRDAALARLGGAGEPSGAVSDRTVLRGSG